jgi:hypothetical protein
MAVHTYTLPLHIALQVCTLAEAIFVSEMPFCSGGQPVYPALAACRCLIPAGELKDWSTHPVTPDATSTQGMHARRNILQFIGDSCDSSMLQAFK